MTCLPILSFIWYFFDQKLLCMSTKSKPLVEQELHGLNCWTNKFRWTACASVYWFSSIFITGCFSEGWWDWSAALSLCSLNLSCFLLQWLQWIIENAGSAFLLKVERLCSPAFLKQKQKARCLDVHRWSPVNSLYQDVCKDCQFKLLHSRWTFCVAAITDSDIGWNAVEAVQNISWHPDATVYKRFNIPNQLISSNTLPN